MEFIMIIYIILFVIFHTSQAIYPDQIDKIDWKKSHIGPVHTVLFSDNYNRLYISTHLGVIAAFYAETGKLIWRQVLPEHDNIDIFIISPENLFTSSSEKKIQRLWKASSGQLMWESDTFSPLKHLSPIISEDFKPQYDQFQATFHPTLGFVGVISPDILSIFSITTGSIVSNFNPPSNSIFLALLSCNDDLCVISKKNGTIFVSQYHDQKDTLQNLFSFQLPSPSINPFYLQGGYCVYSYQDQLYLHSLSSDIPPLITPISTYFPHFSSFLTYSFYPLNSNVFTLSFDSNKILLKIGKSIDKKLTLSLLESSYSPILYSSHGNPSSIYSVQYHQNILQFSTVSSHSVSVDSKHSLIPSFHQDDHGQLWGAWLVNPQKNIWVITSADSSLSWIRGNKIISYYEESLSQIKHLEYFTDSSFSSFNLIHSLNLLFMPSKSSTTPSELLLIITRCGKIFSLDSTNGRILWSFYIPFLSQKSLFSQLIIVRDSPPLALLFFQSVNRLGKVYQICPFNGNITIVSSSDDIFNSQLFQTFFSLDIVNESNQKILLSIDRQQKAFPFPNTPQSYSLLDSYLHNFYYHIISKESGDINGYHLEKNKASQEWQSQNIWSIHFPITEKISSIAYPSTHKIYSSIRLMSRGSVMHKYLNPNLVIISTVSNPNISLTPVLRKDHFNSIFIYFIDVIRGSIIHKLEHAYAIGPVALVFSENFVIFHYFNTKLFRYEISIVEMYENQNNNEIEFSSYTASKPIIYQQTYIFPYGIKDLTVSNTQQGITTHNIIALLYSNQILNIPKEYLDPFRPIDKSQVEEGTIKYQQKLQLSDQYIISYNLSLSHLTHLRSFPSPIESTSIIVAYGLDLFLTHITPASTFDLLDPTFNYFFLITTLLALTIITVIAYYLKKKALLKINWL